MWCHRSASLLHHQGNHLRPGPQPLITEFFSFLSLLVAQHALLAYLHPRGSGVSTPSPGAGLLIEGAVPSVVVHLWLAGGGLDLGKPSTNQKIHTCILRRPFWRLQNPSWGRFWVWSWRWERPEQHSHLCGSYLLHIWTWHWSGHRRETHFLISGLCYLKQSEFALVITAPPAGLHNQRSFESSELLVEPSSMLVFVFHTGPWRLSSVLTLWTQSSRSFWPIAESLNVCFIMYNSVVTSPPDLERAHR